MMRVSKTDGGKEALEKVFGGKDGRGKVDLGPSAGNLMRKNFNKYTKEEIEDEWYGKLSQESEESVGGTPKLAGDIYDRMNKILDSESSSEGDSKKELISESKGSLKVAPEIIGGSFSKKDKASQVAPPKDVSKAKGISKNSNAGSKDCAKRSGTPVNPFLNNKAGIAVPATFVESQDVPGREPAKKIEAPVSPRAVLENLRANPLPRPQPQIQRHENGLFSEMFQGLQYFWKVDPNYGKLYWCGKCSECHLDRPAIECAREWSPGHNEFRSPESEDNIALFDRIEAGVQQGLPELRDNIPRGPGPEFRGRKVGEPTIFSEDLARRGIPMRDDSAQMIRDLGNSQPIPGVHPNIGGSGLFSGGENSQRGFFSNASMFSSQLNASRQSVKSVLSNPNSEPKKSDSKESDSKDSQEKSQSKSKKDGES
jgi:hypothetical protein